MRQTLRRSCTACSKSKQSCDLKTPRCARCTRRKTQCFYANEPTRSLDRSSSLTNYRLGSLDPFDSYPQTRLPNEQVQRLIHSFLHKIAFQYYPLDLNATSNPFLVSWWPLALGDPALFHVSLQTACLDEELLAQNGFRSSEILMADSVALLRRKIENASLAVQDGTMNSVITLATIEFGKGNNKIAEMHVEGVKQLVHMRGGINSVRQTSPLTARMISWVSMLITGFPQFSSQDDFGIGDGIPPIPEWQLEPTATHDLPDIIHDVDYDVSNVFVRLRNVFQRTQNLQFPNTRLHDLTSFVIHRLLYLPSDASNLQKSPVSECVRCAIVLYMFVIQGPTYYSHVNIMNTMVVSLMKNLSRLDATPRVYSYLDIWLSVIGMVASAGTNLYQWFLERSRMISTSLQLVEADDVQTRIKSILWLETIHAEQIFRPHWDAIMDTATRPVISEPTCISSGSPSSRL
ncbi:uncharacterized protein N7477_003237 [Penicillium maclennaniae]|uniref:uncharacterized protein n=1 Tax=Penicillium maclennaniae TaxID=1343394 RepID=UPI0025424C60|nr:uncharacterized protein N7477_003237 [Penicillium maclennaniae]KAJ5677604.1 hypothetical protein N7477_003237 [Penicillium maclennaniae]